MQQRQSRKLTEMIPFQDISFIVVYSDKGLNVYIVYNFRGFLNSEKKHIFAISAISEFNLFKCFYFKNAFEDFSIGNDGHNVIIDFKIFFFKM